MASDPRTYGARCDECWLREHRVEGPVSTELKTGTSALVVADYPSLDDAKSGRILSGEAGIELERALEATGKSRSAVSISSVVLCHPQGGDMDKVIRAFKKENKRLEKEGEPLMPTPNECCRPRLHAELRAMAPHMNGTLNLITLGKGAFSGVARKSCSIFDIRGGPHTAALRHDGSVIEGEQGSVDVKVVAALAAQMDEAGDVSTPSVPLQIVPTLDPFMVTKARRWARAFRSDIGRAIRWFEGRLGWEEPWAVLRPTVAQVREFFDSLSDEVSYDVETDALEPLKAKLRCIGFSTADGGIVIPFLSRDGVTRFYTDREEVELRQLIVELFVNPSIFKVGHNQGSYDRMVVEQHFGVTPAPIIDGLVVHKSVEPELPHGLGYVGSMYTDVLSWKAGHTATQAATDEELWRYNLTDCVVVARSLPHTMQAAALRQQEYTIAQDHRVQSVCVGLLRVGQLIDQERRHEHDIRLLKDAQKFYTQCVSLAGIGAKFNPGSAHQVRDLLFEKWDLSVPTTLGKKKAYTKSGDPSTGDDMILALRTSGRLTPAQNAFLDALRKYRKAAKLRGSYILPLRPQNSMYVLDKFAMELDLEESDSLDPNPDAPTAHAFFEDRFSKDNKKRGLVWLDGRVRADYNIGPTTGRLSCSGGINLQTPPEKLRDMFIPGDGMVFVYADADQLELRLIAALAKSDRYLDIFNKGGDAHAVSASLAFGEKFDRLQKDSPDWESLRKFAKILSYASGYGANIDTVLDVIRSVEDDVGNLIYANVTKAEATKIHSSWLEGAGVKTWWERNMDKFRKLHYMEDPVWGRRRDFLDGEDFCAIQNFECQCVPGWTRVLTKEGYIPIDQLRGREVVAWTGKRWSTARVIAKGTKELYRMHTARGQFFTCDDDHKGKFVGTTGYEWRRFVEGGQNARFAIDLAREQEFGEPMDPMDAYVAGYWTGDGSATPDSYYSHAISFVVANTKPDEQDPRAGEMMWAKLRTWAESRGIELSREEHEGCSSARFYKGTTEWLRSIGADPAWKAATKRVPEAIWRADLAARRAFLVGMLDADGYASEGGGVVMGLCQHALLQDIMLLARTVGVEGTISDPQKVDQRGHIAWKLMLNGSQTFTHLGWGRECKLRTSIFGSTPRFEARRVVDSLNPVTESEKVIRNRIRANPNPPAASPYMLTRMGAEGLYDHDKLISISSRRICVPVYTLSVDDEDHQYVAEGIISKNSGGAAIMHEAVLEVVDAIPFEKWGPGTGLVNYMHDAVLVACPEKEADKVVEIVNAAMNRSTPALPVRFTSKAKIKKRWSEPKKKA